MDPVLLTKDEPLERLLRASIRQAKRETQLKAEIKMLRLQLQLSELQLARVAGLMR